MKAISFLAATAVIAMLSVSCERDLEMLQEKLDHDQTTTPVDSVKTDKKEDPANNETPETTDPTDPSSPADPTSPDVVIIPDSSTDEAKGDLVTKVVELSNFSEVELRKIGELEIVSGSDYKVEVSDYEDMLQYALAFMEGEKLVISYEDNVQVVASKLKVTITIPDRLSKALLSGAGNINILSGFDSESVELSVSGAGKLTAAQINAARVQIEMSGSGSLQAEGKCDYLDINVQGSGPVNCEGLRSGQASCNIGGVCSVFLSVSDKLKVDASGIGTLRYFGNPVLELNVGMLFNVVKG